MFGQTLTEAQMKEVFDTAMKAGLNLWDTAYVYGMGDSEKELGKFVRQQPKGSVILSTKFTPNLADETAADPLDAMLEGSLQRLGVNEIDLYWIHNALDVERWTSYLIPALKSGKVKAVGVSNHNLAQIKRANEILAAEGFRLSAVQNHFSLLLPQFHCRRHVGLLPRKRHCLLRLHGAGTRCIKRTLQRTKSVA